MRNYLVRFSVDHPRWVIALTMLLTALFLLPFPRIETDTDPKHMLPETSPVRVHNDQVEEQFALHADWIALGIVNEQGIFNPRTLGRIARITDQILALKGVIARDVASFTTVDHVLAEGEALTVRPLLTEVPQTAEAMAAFKKALFDNPIFVERLISKDGKATAIYVPIEKTANGKEIAEAIRAIAEREGGEERYYVAGDPVARDTFGAGMFAQMGVFAPIAGMVMFLVLYLMFHSLLLAISIMAVAMISVIWSMGLLIGLGFPVHIMSSMIPVFLMAISTDSIHIFNELCFRFKEVKNKRQAILDTMAVVGAPVSSTAFAAAAGFGSLALIAHIVPVRVFGAFVAFGTLVIRLMSFSLIPAIMILVKEERLLRLSGHEGVEESRATRWLSRLGQASVRHRKAIVVAGLLLFLAGAIGTSQIHINNNMVSWFKKHSEVRQADTAMNDLLGGTSTAYLVAVADAEEAMKRPEVLHYLEGLQRDLEALPAVGKTTSLADIAKRLNRVMHQDDPAYETIPESQEVIAQYLFLFGMAAKPSDLDNFVDYPYQRANIWLQLKTWDATAMRQVLERVQAYEAAHPPPGLEFEPAGIAYFNMVWNDEVLYDMLRGFGLAAVLVFLVVIANFRSLRWGLLGFVPFTFTLVLIYGVIGFIGKDFDMPISVLSTLSLGMAIDFAIHFVNRFKQRYAEDPVVEQTLVWTTTRPGKGILRNALLFALGFSSMAFASLTPYITVGVLVAALMLLSALFTLVYLSALVSLLRGWLLKAQPRPANT
ncbi:MAG: MMPL family transporter [Candidatus Latescibacteria bacterium]|nr:MMPL family transporter [Candidatus Latescibacterota bacterium]